MEPKKQVKEELQTDHLNGNRCGNEYTRTEIVKVRAKLFFK